MTFCQSWVLVGRADDISAIKHVHDSIFHDKGHTTRTPSNYSIIHKQRNCKIDLFVEKM